MLVPSLSVKVSESWRAKVTAMMQEEREVGRVGEAEGDAQTAEGGAEGGGDGGAKATEKEAVAEGGAGDSRLKVRQFGRLPLALSCVVPQELQESGLRSLAEMTSASIELFRKMAEVSLLPTVRARTTLPPTHTHPVSPCHRL